MLVRRLLHDDTLDPADRVAGLLILLFAQPLARIARLTVDQIVDHDGHVSLLPGTSPVQLPPPVDELVLTMRQRRHGYAVGAAPTSIHGCSPAAGPASRLAATRCCAA
jgi:hypothetical protein